MGWAERASRKHQRDRAKMALVKERLDAVKDRLANGERLSSADHRVLSMCGPETLAYIGYEPLVTLQ